MSNVEITLEIKEKIERIENTIKDPLFKIRKEIYSYNIKFDEIKNNIDEIKNKINMHFDYIEDDNPLKYLLKFLIEIENIIDSDISKSEKINKLKFTIDFVSESIYFIPNFNYKYMFLYTFYICLKIYFILYYEFKLYDISFILIYIFTIFKYINNKNINIYFEYIVSIYDNISSGYIIVIKMYLEDLLEHRVFLNMFETVVDYLSFEGKMLYEKKQIIITINKIILIIFLIFFHKYSILWLFIITIKIFPFYNLLFIPIDIYYMYSVIF